MFHWAVVALVAFSAVTAKLGGLWLDWHMRSGYAILALVVFRVLWGFAGSRYARFSQFIRAPADVLRYLRGGATQVAGHSPLGAWSVIALLAVLLVQASTGLFTNDGSFTEGPLARLATASTVERLSTIHRWGEWALYAIVGLHIAAIAYYTYFRRQTLVGPMITGNRTGADVPPADDSCLLRLRALVLGALSASLVAYIVNL